MLVIRCRLIYVLEIIRSGFLRVTSALNYSLHPWLCGGLSGVYPARCSSIFLCGEGPEGNVSKSSLVFYVSTRMVPIQVFDVAISRQKTTTTAKMTITYLNLQKVRQGKIKGKTSNFSNFPNYESALAM